MGNCFSHIEHLPGVQSSYWNMQKFSGDGIVGSGRAKSDFLKGILVIYWTGISVYALIKSYWKKSSCMVFHTGAKAKPIWGVKCCINWHSCFSDFCITSYDSCVCWCTTPVSVSTSEHRRELPGNYRAFCGVLVIYYLHQRSRRIILTTDFLLNIYVYIYINI